MTRAKRREVKWEVRHLDGRITVTASVRKRGFRVAVDRTLCITVGPYFRDDGLFWWKLKVAMRQLEDRYDELTIV